MSLALEYSDTDGTFPSTPKVFCLRSGAFVCPHFSIGKPGVGDRVGEGEPGCMKTRSNPQQAVVLTTEVEYCKVFSILDALDPTDSAR